jgi:hypothetical protein
MRSLYAVLVYWCVLEGSASAVREDACEQQRALYPKSWSDLSNERLLVHCSSHYAGELHVRLGKPNALGNRMMSLTVPDPDDQDRVEVYRIWLDRPQARRLRAGHYFATIVRTESSCWIRGDLGQDSVFFLDDAADATSPTDPPDAGEFYRIAPRFGVLHGNAYLCEPAR